MFNIVRKDVIATAAFYILTIGLLLNAGFQIGEMTAQDNFILYKSDECPTVDYLEEFEEQQTSTML